MKKILLSLLLFFWSIISFWNCATNCLVPWDVISSRQDDSYSNCDYQDSLIVCVYWQVWNVEFPGYWPTYNLQSAPLCTLVADGDYITVHSWNSEYQILVFPSVEEPPMPPECDESVCNLVIYDSFNMMSSNTQFWVEPWGIQDITFSYNSANSSYSVWGSSSNPIYTFSPSSTLLNCSSNLTACNRDLSTMSWNWNSCKTAYNTLSWNYNSCLWELNSCMSNSWSNCSWTWTNWSALYINNIQHLGKPIINIAIPEEISWDYVSTGDIFDLSVVGYNVDPDYIEWIINLQNTKPTEEDFNKLVSEVVPLLVPGLFIIAFLYFAFRFIKKVF